jgi:CheY-like chemotaxis protein
MTARRLIARAPEGQTVLVVDDHAGFRAGIRRLLERQRYRVVEAVDGRDALARAVELRPDVALVDVHLPDLDGFAVASGLRSGGMTGVILLTSTHAVADYAERVSASAANGFVDKADLSAEVILAAVAAPR